MKHLSYTRRGPGDSWVMTSPKDLPDLEDTCSCDVRGRREPESWDFADVDGFDFVVGDDLPDSDMVSKLSRSAVPIRVNGTYSHVHDIKLFLYTSKSVLKLKSSSIK